VAFAGTDGSSGAVSNALLGTDVEKAATLLGPTSPFTSIAPIPGMSSSSSESSGRVDVSAEKGAISGSLMAAEATMD
jgi:hypothetical protein